MLRQQDVPELIQRTDRLKAEATQQANASMAAQDEHKEAQEALQVLKTSHSYPCVELARIILQVILSIAKSCVMLQSSRRTVVLCCFLRRLCIIPAGCHKHWPHGRLQTPLPDSRPVTSLLDIEG